MAFVYSTLQKWGGAEKEEVLVMSSVKESRFRGGARCYILMKDFISFEITGADESSTTRPGKCVSTAK